MKHLVLLIPAVLGGCVSLSDPSISPAFAPFVISAYAGAGCPIPVASDQQARIVAEAIVVEASLDRVLGIGWQVPPPSSVLPAVIADIKTHGCQ